MVEMQRAIQPVVVVVVVAILEMEEQAAPA